MTKCAELFSIAGWKLTVRDVNINLIDYFFLQGFEVTYPERDWSKFTDPNTSKKC
jgi:hypothetical protein